MTLAFAFDRIALTVFALFLTLFGTFAIADSRASGLAIVCIEDAPFLMIRGINYDADVRRPVSTPSFFVNGWGGVDEARPDWVARCIMGERVVEVFRVHQHQPSPRGACGAANWARFDVVVDGHIAATFTNGCAPLQFEMTDYDLTLCASECRRRLWRLDQSLDELKPLEALLFGGFDGE